MDDTKFKGAISNLKMIGYIIVTALIGSCFSVSDAPLEHARIFVYFLGFSFSKLVSILQASHCAH